MLLRNGSLRVDKNGIKDLIADTLTQSREVTNWVRKKLEATSRE